MEMTRRTFVRGIAGVLSALGAGWGWIARIVSPRRVVRAVPFGKYPGRIVPMGDIRRQAKWSG